MEEEKSLTALQRVQLENVAFIPNMGRDDEAVVQNSFSDSDEIRTSEIEQCTNGVSVSSENCEESRAEDCIKCQECGKEFKTEFRLNKHLQTHSLRQSFQCDLCGKSFKLNSMLRAHCREVHSTTKKYTCERCEYATNNKTNCKNHVTRRHLDVNKNGIECNLCDKKCFTTGDLTRHKIKEHDAPRIKCSFCDKSYTSRQYLLIHQMIHKPGFKPEHQCVECGKLFPYSGRLSSHMRKQHSGRRYSCQECGKSVSSPSSLRDHMTQHSGVKSFMCNTCGKTFATRKYLSVHARTHTGEKPYSCEECGMTFTQRSSLSVHVRRYHVDVKPYTCHVCHKGFASNSLLKYHMKWHKV